MGEQFNLFLEQSFRGKVLFNVPLSDYTSFKIGGPADVMAFPRDEADLRDMLAFAFAKDFPVYVLGAGTNVLVRDGGVRGLVVNMTEGFKDIQWTNGVSATVDAGVKLVELLNKCKERGLSGLEFAAGIPGTVGGAVFVNAGAYGKEMKDVVEGAEVLTPNLKRGLLSKSDMGFSYRRSAVSPGSVILRARMKFEKSEPSVVEEKIKEFRKKREATASIKFPNAGSVFKNPDGRVAGKLIEEAGFKGHRVGDVSVSDVHANYIINRGNGKAKDVLILMALIRDKVYGSTGVVLEPEIKVVGED